MVCTRQDFAKPGGISLEPGAVGRILPNLRGDGWYLGDVGLEGPSTQLFYGVHGDVSAKGSTGRACGVYGESHTADNTAYGVFAEADASGEGVDIHPDADKGSDDSHLAIYPEGSLCLSYSALHPRTVSQRGCRAPICRSPVVLFIPLAKLPSLWYNLGAT